MFLDPRLPPGLTLGLEMKLSALGATFVDACSKEAVCFSTPAALGDDSPGPLVVLFDGNLRAEHARALDRKPPALLLACRDGDQSLAPWETELLFAFLAQDSLVPSGSTSVEFHLRQPADMDAAATAAAQFVQASGGGSYVAGAAADVIYELAANALFDAPADMNGVARYAHRRGEALTMEPADAARARIVVDGEVLYIQTADKFGRLTPAPLAAAVRQIGGKVKVNTEGGGAGLGLIRVIDQSDLVAIRVARGRRCEVTCVLTMQNVRRRSARPKSVLFFSNT